MLGVGQRVDIEELADRLAHGAEILRPLLLRDEALRQKLAENTKIRDYTNAGEIEKIYRLLENV